MKIGILTHPLAFNYGDILQCYALSTYLRTKGNDVVVIQRKPDRPFFVKRWIIKSLEAAHIPRFYKKNKLDKARNTLLFVSKNINLTKPIDNQPGIRGLCKEYDIDAVIVGSDQVWRADYAMQFGYNYFLDFVPNNVKKIAYAASFGLSEWKYSPEQTEKIRRCLKSFNAISVREEEAVSLCKENLGVDVIQMPDPTMLLSASDYGKLASKRLLDENYVFIYWLGEKKHVEKNIADYESKGYRVKYVGLRQQEVLPSVEDWLSYIKNADIVLTDSFHGCVFSLLFGKELHVFANDSGGNGRIKSLFRLVGADGDVIKPNDCSHFSSVLRSIQDEAEVFINNSLK